MLAEDRREFPCPHGVVIFAPAITGHQWRAVRTDGVLAGRCASYDEATRLLESHAAPALTQGKPRGEHK